jgi:hypothetical protein
MRPPHAGRYTRFGATLAIGTTCAFAFLFFVSAGGTAPAAVADASFVPGTPFNAGLAPTDAAVADFNGDHAPDLAVANCRDAVDPGTGDPLSRSEVRILLGDGKGSFRAGSPPPLPAGARTCSLASADVNGDNAPDLAVAISSGSAVATFLNDGTGHFTAAPGSPVRVVGAPTGLVAADVTGDGRADLVIPVYDAASKRVTGIDVLLGDGRGGFAEAPGSPAAILAGTSVDVTAADIDGNGKADVALANTQRNEISVLRGDGTGRLGPQTSVASARRPQAIAIRDIDRDAKPDLAALVTNGVAIYLGDGLGSFHAAPGSPVSGGGSDLTVTDLNGDGIFDLVTSNGDGNSVSVRVGTGGGAFRAAAYSPFPARYPLRLAAADFDGDGRTDLAALAGGAPYWPVAPRGSVVLLQTPSAPAARPGRALGRRGAAVFATRRQITALAADGKHAAVCASGVPIAWSAPGRTSVRFKTGSYGGCYGDVAVGAGRVAWTEGVGCGNTFCDDAVFVAKLSGGRRHKVDEKENDCGAGPCYPTGIWISQLLGGGPLIAWDDWKVDCTGSCTEGEGAFAGYAVTAQLLRRFYGGRARTVRRDTSAHPLLAVGAGRMALEVSGTVVVLKPTGARVTRVVAADAESVALAQTELGLAGRTSLAVYDSATGHLRKSIALGPSAALQLAGITSRLALLRGPHSLVLVRLRDGRLISFPLASKVAKRLVDAKLTSAGLFYAYNVAKRKANGRIVFERTPMLLARF